MVADLLMFLSLRLAFEWSIHLTSLDGRLAALIASLVPRGAYSLLQLTASVILGLFILGACFETAWKIELAEAMDAGRTVPLGGYEVTLDSVEYQDG